METLLGEHSYHYAPFRALIGADLSPHDQQALANAAGNNNIGDFADFICAMLR